MIVDPDTQFFEVLANYTIYDFEESNPGVQSFSFRQISYQDSIIAASNITIDIGGDTDGEYVVGGPDVANVASLTVHVPAGTRPGVYKGEVYVIDYEFDGKIDEVRISSVVRSSGYITTTYNNINSPSTFYSVGSEQSTAFADCIGTPSSPCHMCDVDDMDFLLRDPDDVEDPRGWQQMTYSSSSGTCGSTPEVTETWTKNDGYVFCPKEGTYDIKVRAHAEGDPWETEESDWTVAYTVNYDSDSNWCECKVGPGRWAIGGEVAPDSCCGDDANEYNLTRICSSGCTSNSTDDACCNADTKCVYDSTCYADAACYDSAGLHIKCNSGSWIDHCTNGVQDCDETGTDCGGSCPPCCKANGETCSVDSECCSGYCVDGYCCDSACDSPCDRCDDPSSLGNCTPYPPGQYIDCNSTIGCVSDGIGEKVCACNGTASCIDTCGDDICQSWETSSCYDCRNDYDFKVWIEGPEIFTIGKEELVYIYVQNLGGKTDSYEVSYTKEAFDKNMQPVPHLITVSIPSSIILSVEPDGVAVEEGLGTCWIGAFYQDEVKRILNIPRGYKVVALLPLGFPADTPGEKYRKPLNEIVCYEVFK